MTSDETVDGRAGKLFERKKSEQTIGISLQCDGRNPWARDSEE